MLLGVRRSDCNNIYIYMVALPASSALASPRRAVGPVSLGSMMFEGLLARVGRTMQLSFLMCMSAKQQTVLKSVRRITSQSDQTGKGFLLTPGPTHSQRFWKAHKLLLLVR